MAPFSSNRERIDYYDDDSSGYFVSTSLAESATGIDGKHSSMDDSLSSSKSSLSVTFSPGVAVHCVLHINDFSSAEKLDSWYGAEDLRRVRQEWKDTVALMEQTHMMDAMDEKSGKSFDSAQLDYCFRGLEGKTVIGKRRRREARAASLEVVLDEQSYQAMDDDMSDPIMIAVAYQEYTFLLQVEAFQQAQEDAREVEQYHNENIQPPSKFDFRAVRAKYFADCESCRNKNLVSVTSKTASSHRQSSNKFLLTTPRNGLRTKISCFLPLTAKRYA